MHYAVPASVKAVRSSVSIASIVGGWQEMSSGRREDKWRIAVALADDLAGESARKVAADSANQTTSQAAVKTASQAEVDAADDCGEHLDG